eukprot:2467780-Pyramimonas_sp.AAC.1
MPAAADAAAAVETAGVPMGTSAHAPVVRPGVLPVAIGFAVAQRARGAIFRPVVPAFHLLRGVSALGGFGLVNALVAIPDALAIAPYLAMVHVVVVEWASFA